ncbi:DNA-3-methyladenine glycosylase I [Salegentibacter sp. JZCK2]|uniref:DNA-3-methyladenine glycosylase I n=1 Tax=Salegentibacter tibetensis TaxID=2873600 RepID=UPI001CCF47CA|nr:DNA-3-methyladenine glycosylase I [Salegentibacter tibetensis]MBZ9729589.1 DNA-3-methyladenine glycosylase I [Salegentibacter tibetensis]
MKRLNRCGWCEGDELYEAYHDNEWGVPVYDDDTIFEFLILETFQAGLSWITVLRKRENFRKAFDDFDYKKIANYSEEKIQELLENAGIIRNKLKVRATVTNAQNFIKIQEEYGSFSEYIWSFVDGSPVQNEVENYKEAPATTNVSDKLSKDLKKKGFKFVGSTVMYAHMQATGMVNDHEISCFRHKEIEKLEKKTGTVARITN